MMQPFLARDPAGAVFLVDGSSRAAITSAVLVAALEHLYGVTVDVTAADLAPWPEGPAVVVYHEADRPPFVIVQGERLPIVGLPPLRRAPRSSGRPSPAGPTIDLARVVGTALAPTNVPTPFTTHSLRRRPARANGWLGSLHPRPATADAGPTPRLVRAPSGRVFLIEGDTKRAVRSGMLLHILENEFTDVIEGQSAQLEAMPTGAPVELLEGPEGRPFLVIAGQRRAVRGMPLPYPTGSSQMLRFPKGPAIDVGRATVARRRFVASLTPGFHAARVRRALARRGPFGVATLAGRRTIGRVGRRLRPRRS